MDPIATAVAAEAATVITTGAFEDSELAPDAVEAEVRWQSNDQVLRPLSGDLILTIEVRPTAVQPLPANRADRRAERTSIVTRPAAKYGQDEHRNERQQVGAILGGGMLGQL